MSAFESLLSVYETVRGQHNHGACSHLIARFLCRCQEKSTMKSEYEKQKDALISERDTALFDVNVAQARCQSISTQVDGRGPGADGRASVCIARPAPKEDVVV